MDLMKTQFLDEKLFPFLVANLEVLESEETIDRLKEKLKYSEPVELPSSFKVCYQLKFSL